MPKWVIVVTFCTNKIHIRPLSSSVKERIVDTLKNIQRKHSNRYKDSWTKNLIYSGGDIGNFPLLKFQYIKYVHISEFNASKLFKC